MMRAWLRQLKALPSNSRMSLGPFVWKCGAKPWMLLGLAPNQSSKLLIRYTTPCPAFGSCFPSAFRRPQLYSLLLLRPACLYSLYCPHQRQRTRATPSSQRGGHRHGGNNKGHPTKEEEERERAGKEREERKRSFSIAPPRTKRQLDSHFCN